MYTVDYTGRRYGKLVVIKREGKNEKRNRTQWLCQCDCGNTSIHIGDDLRNGGVKSCGCMSSRHTAGDRTRTHGLAHTPIYNVYRGMKERCNTPSNKSYGHYGGRGIKVCDGWKTFEGFYSDMGSTYKQGLTLERIDCDGDYCPENCTWATRIEQARNKRNVKTIIFQNKTYTLADLCRELNIPYKLAYRKLRNGYKVEDIFSAI